MVEQLGCVHSMENVGGQVRSWPLIAEFLDHLRQAGMMGGLQNFPGPAKHFLVWIGRNGIELGAVDLDVVRQFLVHDCDCPRPPGERYQSRHLQTRTSKDASSGSSNS